MKTTIAFEMDAGNPDSLSPGQSCRFGLADFATGATLDNINCRVAAYVCTHVAMWSREYATAEVCSHA